MKKYINRMLYRSEGRKVPFLIYPFLLMTLIPGIAYTFFGSTGTVKASVLFGLTFIQFGPAGLSLWGLAAITAVLLAFSNIIFRKKWAGRSAPVLGFMVWVYAFIVYLMGGFVYQLLAAALPQIIFWIWHFIRVEDYWRNFDAGIEYIE